MHFEVFTVGSPQQVIDRTLRFRDRVGDHQRQPFLIGHAGHPRRTVLKQMELLGEHVLPILRREFEALRPAYVPADPPRRPACTGSTRRDAGAVQWSNGARAVG